MVGSATYHSPLMLNKGDANGSGIVDAADLAIWEEQFGARQVSGLASVPEPTSVTMVFVTLQIFSAFAERRAMRYSESPSCACRTRPLRGGDGIAPAPS